MSIFRKRRKDVSKSSNCDHNEFLWSRPKKNNFNFVSIIFSGLKRDKNVQEVLEVSKISQKSLFFCWQFLKDHHTRDKLIRSTFRGDHIAKQEVLGSILRHFCDIFVLATFIL